MSCRAVCPIVTLGLLLPLTAGAPGQDQPPPEGAQKAIDAVRAFLMKKSSADNAQIGVENAPVLAKVFPEHLFVVVRFRQYPVARVLPEGLKASNIFAVTKREREVRLLRDAKELEAFFKASQVPADDEPWARKSLAAWLTLAPEFRQDGFYKFEVLEKEFDYEKTATHQVVRGRALVTQGGKGEIGATLEYDRGTLTKATEAGKIMPGPRPICQATKLLDPDPIVRKMAEQDLLFMGLAARDYLMDQRAQAGPELRDAIDRLWGSIRAAGW